MFHRAIDLFLRAFEQGFAISGKRFAFFEKLHCAVEFHVAVLELFDDRFEAGNLLFEGTRCLISHRAVLRGSVARLRRKAGVR